MRLIALSVGHSTLDCGAVGIDGTKEYDLNLKVVKLLLGEFNLKNGIWWLADHDTDDEPYPDHLNHTIKNINENEKVVACVEIHHNSCGNPKRKGGEIIYYDSSMKGRLLAQAIEQQLDFMNINSEGVKQFWNRQGKFDYDADDKGQRHIGRRLGFLTNTNPPAVIPEPFFLSNKEDLALAKKYSRPVAKAIQQAVDIWLKVI